MANVITASEMSLRADVANYSQVNAALALSKFIDAMMQHQWVNIGEESIQFLYRDVMLQNYWNCSNGINKQGIKEIVLVVCLKFQNALDHDFAQGT